MTVLEQYFDILKNLPNYEPRKAQELMIEQVASAMAESRSVVVEAGTGSGKSFGYLIPALLSQTKPIVISTGTIALQEQLLLKDIPFLAEAAGRQDLNVKLVKGRGNYLCIQKMMELERELRPNAGERLHINYLKSELQRGWDGDSGTLDLSIPRELWDEIKSESEDCLGRRCRFYQENPYRLAREDIAEADIIIANHALYLQDYASGQALLPPHEVVIFDEAHQLKPYALNALTDRIGKYATTKLLRKITRRLGGIPEEFHYLFSQTEASILEWVFRSDKSIFRMYPDDRFLEVVSKHMQALESLQQWVTGLNVKQLSIVESELDADKVSIQRAKLMSQLQGLIGRWEHFLSENPFAHERVNWAETQKDKLYYELKSTPLNIGEMLRNGLWPEKTAILTSATLSTHNGLKFFKENIGLDDATDVVLPSVFDYQKQCTLYLPHHMPDPNSFEFSLAIADEIEALLHLSGGRAFVLFTSNQNMKKVSDALIPRLPFACKVQGEMTRNRLIEWFRTTPQSILFATSTFWEGIDIPGDALSCVIIDKIPFQSPEDPINQAVVDYLKSQGKDWFNESALPQAIIKIKQGFGRLIRSKTDRGLVAILDPRMHQKGYGKKIQHSLPTVRVIHSLEGLSAEDLNLSAVG